MAEATLSGPRTQRKRAADFTGIQTERLNAAKSLEEKEAASRLAMATAQAVEESNLLVDYSGHQDYSDIERQEIEVNEPIRTIRVNTELEQMTFGRKVVHPGDPQNGIAPIMGAMNTYDFKPGTPYRVSKELAEHLDAKGYLSYLGS
jgi:hypothetical protein